MEIKIRPLTVSDNRFLIKLINKLIKDYKEKWITELIKPDKKKVSPTSQEDNKEDNKEDNNDEKAGQVFLTIINSLIDHFTNEITIWFSSLLDIQPEEYDRLPFDTDAIVIEQIMKDPKFKFFFQRAYAAFKQVKSFGGWLS